MLFKKSELLPRKPAISCSFARQSTLFGTCVVISLLACFANKIQASAPPNDNFTNRIVLAGTNVPFTGTLAGATFEFFWNQESASYFPEIMGYPILSGYSAPTVWWTWTPEQSTTAIFQILYCSKSTYADGLVVYDRTNLDVGEPVAGTKIDSEIPYRYFSFPAHAGTNYQIQLVGSDSAAFAMKLIATDLPYLIQQPQNQAVTAGDSILLTAIAAGKQPFTYQWQFNGNNLAGETTAMLALDQLATNQSGLYRILVTNSAGVTFSDSASLLVTAADTPPTLVASLGSTQFAFSLQGEAGRRYRIESSTNLASWLPEASFPAPIFYDAYVFQRPLRSVVLDATGADSFTVQNISQSQFFRAHDFHAVNEVCNNNLKKIRFAQLLFAGEHQADRNTVVSRTDLYPYLKNGLFPNCPSNGFYSITTVLANPRCLTGYHPFEEP
jgi:hypothetical protein